MKEKPPLQKFFDKKYDTSSFIGKLMQIIKILFPPKKKRKKNPKDQPYDKTHMNPSIERDARIDQHAIKVPHAIAGETEKMNAVHNAQLHRPVSSTFKKKHQSRKSETPELKGRH